MTDAASLAQSTASPREVIQRRLVGLGVLLLFVFLLSLLLRNGGAAPEALPAVVIPLSGEAPAAAPVVAPTLGVDESEAKSETRPEAVGAADSPVAEPARAAAAGQPKRAAPPPEAAAKPRVEAAKPEAASTKPPQAPAVVAKPAAAPRWFVVVGAYKDPVAAGAIARRVQMAGFKAETVPVTTAGEHFNRVRAGPFATKSEAESARVTLIVEGLTKAVIASEK